MPDQLSFKDNDETQPKNAEEGVEMENGVADLFYEIGMTLRAGPEADIKSRRENTEYAEVNNVQKTIFWGPVWYVGP